MSVWGSLLTAAVLAAAVVAPAAAGIRAAGPVPVACRETVTGEFVAHGKWPAGVPQPRARPAPVRGPCSAADSVAILPRAAGPVFLTNFGLLFDDGPAPADAGADATTGGRRYGLVCEESFGGKVPDRLVEHPDRRLLLATADGVYAAPSDGCGFVRAAGSTAFRDIAEVAWDPGEPRRLYALARRPAELHVSEDAGATFSRAYEFPPELQPVRLYVLPGAAAGAPARLYVGGLAPGQPLVLARSDDGGRGWSYDRFAPEVFGRPEVAVVLDGPGRAPGTWFAAAGTPDGSDQIFRSSDDGRSWTRVLVLVEREIRAGLALGEGDAVYVAGRDPFPNTMGPGAHLYVSRDGGSTFAAPLPSPADGPRFRCLVAAGARLYGCGGDPRDAFLFGFSDDGGHSWTPAATVTDIAAPRACTSGRCLPTALWLCNMYGVCAPDLPEPGTVPELEPDAGAADGGGQVREGGGCGCRVAGRAAADAPVAAALMFVSAAGALRRRLCRKSRRRSS